MKILKTILLVIFVTFIVSTQVLALSMQRQVPSSALPGSSFSVSYQTQGAPSSGKWFVAWEDTITGGCTPASYKNFMVSETGGDSSLGKTFVAPSSGGTCKFSGYYQAADGVQTNFQDFTITIGTCTPSWQTGAWSTCSSGTQTRTVTDSNNCGVTSGKPAESQSCSMNCSESWQCSSWTTCSNSTLTQTRTCTDLNSCGTTSSQPITSQSCSVGGTPAYCQYAEKIAFIDLTSAGISKCAEGTVFAIIALVIIILIVK